MTLGYSDTVTEQNAGNKTHWAIEAPYGRAAAREVVVGVVCLDEGLRERHHRMYFEVGADGHDIPA